MDSARALVAGGWRISLVSRCLRVSRAQLHAMARRSKDWQDRRCKRKPDDTDALARIHTVIGDLPTYGYRRVWALLRRQSETDDMAVINAKRVYRIMHQNALLLERKPEIPPSKRAHTGKVTVGESNQRWCSDGFEFSCDNGEKLRVTFALDCCDREGTVAKLAMRQPFVLFKGLTFQKLCLPGAFRPGDHHNKMLRPGLCVVHASPQYL